MNPKMWKKIGVVAGAIAAVVAAWLALEQVGVRPALNGEVMAAEVRLQQQVDVLEILILQDQRRYWQEQLAAVRAAARRDPTNGTIQRDIREIEATLQDIQGRIRLSRS